MFWKRENASKAEWVMFLIITVLLIVIIFYFGRDFLIQSVFLSQDKRLFDAISFSGTVVSIILGLLAIIYTLFQGFSSQSASEKLAIQIESLERVVAESGLQQESLGGSIEKLVKIDNSIDVLTKSFGRYSEENRAEISQISNEISRINIAAKNASVGHQMGPAQQVSRRLPSDFTWNTFEAVAIAFFVLSKNKKISIAKMLSGTNTDIFGEDYPKTRISAISGVFYTLALGMNWLDFSGATPIFTPEAYSDVVSEEFIRESAEFESYEGESLEGIESIIKKITDKS